MNINEKILEVLNNALKVLSKEAVGAIRTFIKQELQSSAYFVDRAGKADPYYSVFGYSLCYILGIDVDYKKASRVFYNWEDKNKLDLIHAISLLRCRFLIDAFKYKKRAGRLFEYVASSKRIQHIAQRELAKKIRRNNRDLLKLIDTYRTKNLGYNHFVPGSENATVYANFLVAGLFQDLMINGYDDEFIKSIEGLKLQDESFVNQVHSKQGVSSSTSAAIVLLKSYGHPFNQSAEWLLHQFDDSGGVLAAPGAPIADVLSTGTSVFALHFCDHIDNNTATKAAEFVNLHWHESGGFFGSIADQHPDVEYTFYALLAIGALA